MEDDSEENKEFSTDINDYNSPEEVEEALKSDIRDELIENIEEEIREAAHNVDTNIEDGEYKDALEYYFESDDFFDDLRSNCERDISYVPDEIITNIIGPYTSISRSGNSLFSLDQRSREKGFESFATIKYGDENYVDPSTYIDFIHLIPKSYVKRFAMEFWTNIPDVHIGSPYNFNPKTIDGERASLEIYFSKEMLEEMALDMRIAYFQEASNDPDFVNNFLNVIEEDYSDYSRTLRRLITQNSLTTEEQIDIIRLFFDQDNKIEMDTLIHRVSEFVNTKNIEPEGILSIPKEVIKNWDIRKGTLYENAPWTIYNLKATELFGEGVDMRLCLSDPEMPYYSQVMDSEIEIWSIRSKNGKRRFTIEIDAKFREAVSPEEKGKLVYQVKGKTNRLAGYENSSSKTIKFFDEVVFFMNLFYDLGIDIFNIEDMRIQALEVTKLNEEGLLSSKL